MYVCVCVRVSAHLSCQLFQLLVCDLSWSTGLERWSLCYNVIHRRRHTQTVWEALNASAGACVWERGKEAHCKQHVSCNGMPLLPCWHPALRTRMSSLAQPSVCACVCVCVILHRYESACTSVSQESPYPVSHTSLYVSICVCVCLCVRACVCSSVRHTRTHTLGTWTQLGTYVGPHHVYMCPPVSHSATIHRDRDVCTVPVIAQPSVCACVCVCHPTFNSCFNTLSAGVRWCFMIASSLAMR